MFLLHEKEQSAGYWLELGVRLYMQCGMVWKVMKTYPMSADAMRVVVPYKNSISATPKHHHLSLRLLPPVNTPPSLSTLHLLTLHHHVSVIHQTIFSQRLLLYAAIPLHSLPCFLARLQ